MPRYGRIEDNILTDLIIADQDFVDTLDGVWVLCTDKNGVGNQYDPVSGTCYPPKPFPSWVKDIPNNYWVAPVPPPDDHGFGEGEQLYIWDEGSQSWTVNNT